MDVKEWQDKVDRLYYNMSIGCYSQLNFEYLLNAIGPKPINTNKTATEVRMQSSFFTSRIDAAHWESKRKYDDFMLNTLKQLDISHLLSQQQKKDATMSNTKPTPNTNVKHQQEIINAYLEKKDVQWWNKDRWQDVVKGQERFFFYFNDYAYRIKPEPREFIVGIPNTTSTGGHRIHLHDPRFNVCSSVFDYIKVREVLED